MFGWNRKSSEKIKNKLICVIVTSRACGVCPYFKSQEMPQIARKFEKLNIKLEHFDFFDFGKFTIEEERKSLIHPNFYKMIHSFPMIFLFIEKSWENKKIQLIGEDISIIRKNLDLLDNVVKKYENKDVIIPVPFVLQSKYFIERKPIPENQKKIIIRDRSSPIVEEIE